VPDNSFEFGLERMFAETPRRPDSDLFAARVLERLDRGWTARRLLIGAMGAVGGVIGAGQLLGASALGDLSTAGTRSNDFFNQHLPHELTGLLAPTGLEGAGQAIWMATALAVVAVGFGVARLVREI
jgi:hypothetical protein